MDPHLRHVYNNIMWGNVNLGFWVWKGWLGDGFRLCVVSPIRDSVLVAQTVLCGRLLLTFGTIATRKHNRNDNPLQVCRSIFDRGRVSMLDYDLPAILLRVRLPKKT